MIDPNVAIIMAAVVASLPGLAALGFQIKTWYTTRRKINSEASEADASAAKNYADAAGEMAKQYNEVMARQREMEKELRECSVENLRVTRLNDQLRDWAERLCNQLREHDYIPVPMDITRPKAVAE